MKKAILWAVLAFATVLSAQAVEMIPVTCWKGLSPKEQTINLTACQKQRGPGQTCSTSMWEHGGAAFDVCLMGPAAAPTKIVTVFKGLNQAEQEANLAICEAHAQPGQLCITSIWVHGQAVYDVCLME